jgi:uncharacterized protein (TIGR02145 family)
MKALLFFLVFIIALVSCKKETVTPTNNDNSVNDTLQASISSLECSNLMITGVLKKDSLAIGVSFKLKYLGGNGKAFLAQTISSTGVTGLTASLVAGTLSNGTGYVNFEVSGKPSSEGEATFAINFGGKTCSVIISVAGSQPVSGYGSDIIDYEGNSYKTIYIGNQQWMAENLKVSKFNDGTAINQVTDKSQWINQTTPAWTYYNNSDINNTSYGKLYNWYVTNSMVNGDKNVCPTGWHVPTDTDWDELINYLDSTAEGGINYPNVAGSKLKQVGISNWITPNSDATNSTLFTALPGGLRGGIGDFYSLGYAAYFWSETEKDTDNAWCRSLNNLNSYANKKTTGKPNGLSIRCIKN